jgi:hypothetical protein
LLILVAGIVGLFLSSSLQIAKFGGCCWFLVSCSRHAAIERGKEEKMLWLFFWWICFRKQTSCGWFFWGFVSSSKFWPYVQLLNGAYFAAKCPETGNIIESGDRMAIVG